MSDVVEFKQQKQAPAKPPKSRFCDDEYLLRWCAEWRAARAQQQKNWAEHELATMWGTLPDAHIKLDTTPLARMQEIEDHLAGEIGRPHTILAARELLGIVVTILSHEDPESTLAHGPLLEIVRNVVKELEYIKADMPLRSKREREN